MMAAMLCGNIVTVKTGREGKSLEMVVAVDITKNECVYWECECHIPARVPGMMKFLRKGKLVWVSGRIRKPRCFMTKAGEPDTRNRLLIDDVSLGQDWKLQDKIEKDIAKELGDSLEAFDD